MIQAFRNAIQTNKISYLLWFYCTINCDVGSYSTLGVVCMGGNTTKMLKIFICQILAQHMYNLIKDISRKNKKDMGRKINCLMNLLNNFKHLFDILFQITRKSRCPMQQMFTYSCSTFFIIFQRLLNTILKQNLCIK